MNVMRDFELSTRRRGGRAFSRRGRARNPFTAGFLGQRARHIPRSSLSYTASLSYTSTSGRPGAVASGSSMYRTPQNARPMFNRPGRMSVNRTTPTSGPLSTSGPRSSSSNHSEASTVIVALSEGRGHARGEVGLAAIDIHRPHLLLCQLSDNQCYIGVKTKIFYLNPREIIMPSTCLESSFRSNLYDVLRLTFPDVTISPITRALFNEKEGHALIDTYCMEKYASVKILLARKFYASAAASAIIKYVERMQAVLFSPGKLKIDYQANNFSTLIDLETSTLLELTAPLSGHNPKGCLYGCLNYCVTGVGKRALRATVLEPSCDVNCIEGRLDAVTELVNNQEMLQSIHLALIPMAQVDLLSSLCMRHNRSADQIMYTFDNQLNLALLLKKCVSNVPILFNAILDGESGYFGNVRETLNSSCWEYMKNEILKVVYEETQSSIGNNSYLSKCYIIKPNINVLLDIARRSYSEAVDDINGKIAELAAEHNLSLAMTYTNTRSFHIKLTPTVNFDPFALPETFLNVKKMNKYYTCTTESILCLDAKIKTIIKEIQIMSNVIINVLVDSMRNSLHYIYELIDIVGELDLIQSFATVSQTRGHVRPQFGNELEIIKGVHPVLQHVLNVPPTPNDVVASTDYNIYIITGPNMSGKSIYIRQVALLQIMAQVGCYVPAEKATFRIADRIFSRIGFNDSLENNASTYVLEMNEMRYITDCLTSTSIVIVDELCRGTAKDEGTAMAWALMEEMDKKCKTDQQPFIFFTTHFKMLTQMPSLYYNFSNLHLEALDGITETGRAKLLFTHKVKLGVTDIKDYGIKLAKASNLPADIVEHAEVLLCKIKERESVPTTEDPKISDHKILYDLAVSVRNMENPSNIDTIMKDFAQKFPNILEHIEDFDESFKSAGSPFEDSIIRASDIQDLGREIYCQSTIKENKIDNLADFQDAAESQQQPIDINFDDDMQIEKSVSSTNSQSSNLSIQNILSSQETVLLHSKSENNSSARTKDIFTPLGSPKMSADFIISNRSPMFKFDFGSQTSINNISSLPTEGHVNLFSSPETSVNLKMGNRMLYVSETNSGGKHEMQSQIKCIEPKIESSFVLSKKGKRTKNIPCKISKTSRQESPLDDLSKTEMFVSSVIKNTSIGVTADNLNNFATSYQSTDICQTGEMSLRENMQPVIADPSEF